MYHLVSKETFDGFAKMDPKPEHVSLSMNTLSPKQIQALFHSCLKALKLNYSVKPTRSGKPTEDLFWTLLINLPRLEIFEVENVAHYSKVHQILWKSRSSKALTHLILCNAQPTSFNLLFFSRALRFCDKLTKLELRFAKGPLEQTNMIGLFYEAFLGTELHTLIVSNQLRVSYINAVAVLMRRAAREGKNIEELSVSYLDNFHSQLELLKVGYQLNQLRYFWFFNNFAGGPRKHLKTEKNDFLSRLD